MGLFGKLFRGGNERTSRVFDLRSDGYKRMEEEVAAEQQTDSPEFERLCDKLARIVQEGNNWGKANSYPAVSKYPQYQKIHGMGKQIYKIAGFKGMQRASLVVKSRCHSQDGPANYLVEWAWSGIGGWLP